MAWTAKIQSVEKQSGKAHIIIQYTDGVSPFSEDLWLTNPQTLNDVVATRIAQLNSIDIFVTGLVNGAPISSTPTPPVTLSQAQIDQQTFLTDYRTLQGMKRAIDVGIKTVADADYIALQNKTKAEFLTAYNTLL